ncbi:hypothetical protein Tco_0065980 [Tanacetum coccineum]
MSIPSKSSGMICHSLAHALNSGCQAATTAKLSPTLNLTAGAVKRPLFRSDKSASGISSVLVVPKHRQDYQQWMVVEVMVKMVLVVVVRESGEVVMTRVIVEMVAVMMKVVQKQRHQ